MYGDRVEKISNNYELLAERIKNKVSMFNIFDLVNEQTIIYESLNFTQNYMVALIKVIFDATISI